MDGERVEYMTEMLGMRLQLGCTLACLRTSPFCTIYPYLSVSRERSASVGFRVPDVSCSLMSPSISRCKEVK